MALAVAASRRYDGQPGVPARAAHHRLARTPLYAPEEGEYLSGAWSKAHRAFYRTLLEECGNPVLVDAFDPMWTASEPGRRWGHIARPVVTPPTNIVSWRRRPWPATPTPRPTY